MTSYLIHTAQSGDRWDLLAWRYYGDALAYEGILAANPTIPITPEITPHTRILIPVLDAADLPSSSESLPPWLR